MIEKLLSNFVSHLIVMYLSMIEKLLSNFVSHLTVTYLSMIEKLLSNFVFSLNCNVPKHDREAVVQLCFLT
jgi:hypothetical protein